MSRIFRTTCQHYYAIEDGDDTEEGEESEILVIHDSNPAASKQNLSEREFSYINMFDHEGPVVVSVMCNLSSRLFEKLDITSPMEVDQSIAFMEHILRGAAL